MGKNMIDLPVEALNNTISFNLGKPEYIKLKYNPKFRDIQKRYKMKYSEPYYSYAYELVTHKKSTFVSYSIKRIIQFIQ